MQELLRSFLSNAANPAVLFFLIGLLATVLRVQLPIPNGFKTVLTVYLMAAIGFKGGVAVSSTGLGNIWVQAVGLALLSAVVPLWVYPAARYLGRFSSADSAGLAAHYGSVSAVTFAAALSYLNSAGIAYEGAAPAFLAVMEVPGIIVALVLYNWVKGRKSGESQTLAAVNKEILRSKSVFVLLAALVAGYLSGAPGLAATEGFFVTPFQGILTLFLLEMGMEAGNRLSALRSSGFALTVLALGLPILQGTLGVGVGLLLGFSVGGAALVGTLAASASYIAAPAAVRLMVPEASPSIYLTAALGITFPFNVVIGIPLYLAIAQRFVA